MRQSTTVVVLKKPAGDSLPSVTQNRIVFASRSSCIYASAQLTGCTKSPRSVSGQRRLLISNRITTTSVGELPPDDRFVQLDPQAGSLRWGNEAVLNRDRLDEDIAVQVVGVELLHQEIG